jgi:CBS domain containing-hemolysin-like protein
VGLKKELKDDRPLPSSAEEIAHIIEASQVFSSDDTRLLKSALGFRRRLVKDNMTPKDKIISVPYDELLGPLVLDGLHKTGHTLFPVMKGDDIVGILDSSGHVAVRDQNSAYVRDVMYTDSVNINQEATLDDALQLFLTSKQRLLIVVNDEAKTTGLLSLGDVVRALTGQKQ